MQDADPDARRRRHRRLDHQKSNRKRSAPTGSDGGLTIANPERLTKPKQMKVFLLKDLDRFGKEGA